MMLIEKIEGISRVSISDAHFRIIQKIVLFATFRSLLPYLYILNHKYSEILRHHHVTLMHQISPETDQTSIPPFNCNLVVTYSINGSSVYCYATIPSATFRFVMPMSLLQKKTNNLSIYTTSFEFWQNSHCEPSHSNSDRSCRTLRSRSLPIGSPHSYNKLYRPLQIYFRTTEL